MISTLHPLKEIEMQATLTYLAVTVVLYATVYLYATRKAGK